MMLNKELSMLLETQYGELFKIRSCYKNVFEIMTDYIPVLSHKDVRVLFCYAYNGSYYYRHAFCVCKGELIEPLGKVRENLMVEKTIPICELDFNDYIKLILREERYDLFSSLFAHNIRAINKNKKQMKQLNPIEANDIVSYLTKTADDALIIFRSLIAGNGIPDKYIAVHDKL